MVGGGGFRRSPRKNKPKQYRRHINNFKRLRENGAGFMATWKPETFRDYAKGWRQIIIMDIAGAVALVLYILYRVFVK